VKAGSSAHVVKNFNDSSRRPFELRSQECATLTFASSETLAQRGISPYPGNGTTMPIRNACRVADQISDLSELLRTELKDRARHDYAHRVEVSPTWLRESFFTTWRRAIPEDREVWNGQRDSCVPSWKAPETARHTGIRFKHTFGRAGVPFAVIDAA